MIRYSHSNIFFVAVFVCAALFIVPSYVGASFHGVDSLTKEYALPPSMGNLRWLYAATLAMLVTMSLLSQQAIIENVRMLAAMRGPRRSPAKVALLNETIFMGVVALGVTPDAVQLLAWGEETAPANSVLVAFDRAFDFVSGALFLLYLVRRIRSRPVMLFQLNRLPYPVDLDPTWKQLQPNIMTIGAIVLLSVGVAFGK